MLVILLLVFLADVCFAACPSTWQSFNGSCYKLINDLQTWPDAMYECKSIYMASLVVIETVDEEHFLENMAKALGGPMVMTHIWTAGADLRVENKWVWEPSGNPITYSKWGPKEPNNYHGNENCVMLDADQAFMWHDRPCFDHYRYICEKKETI